MGGRWFSLAQGTKPESKNNLKVIANQGCTGVKRGALKP